MMITRRKALLGMGGAFLATSLRSNAQQPVDRFVRIGVLAEGPSPSLDGLYQGLRELGYVENKNLSIERRFTGTDPGKARALAQELVDLKVEVIFARASTFVEPARQATTQIPIVFSNHNDPVGSGHVKSLAQPGGNITGVTAVATELNMKQLQLLMELVPGLSRVAVLANPTTPSHVPALKELGRAGEILKLKLRVVGARTVEEMGMALTDAEKARDQAMLVLTSPLSLAKPKEIATVTLKHRLPVMFGIKPSVEAGALVSYGPDLADLSRRAAVYIDRIFKGERPANMAVEQPTRFELVLNLKAANALGLKIPQSFLLRTDRLIE